MARGWNGAGTATRARSAVAVLGLVAGGLAVLPAPVPAAAALPGANGRIAFGERRHRHREPRRPRRDRSLTSDASDTAPAWSPNGTQIAFASASLGRRRRLGHGRGREQPSCDLTAGSAAADTAPLVPRRHPDRVPDRSGRRRRDLRDGRRRRRPDQPHERHRRRHPARVVAGGRDTSPSQPIGTGTTRCTRWTSDGRVRPTSRTMRRRTALPTGRRTAPGSPSRATVAATADIFTMDGERRQPDGPHGGSGSEDRNPACSPSGQRIAFARNGVLFAMDDDGTAPAEVVGDAGLRGVPDWQPLDCTIDGLAGGRDPQRHAGRRRDLRRRRRRCDPQPRRRRRRRPGGRRRRHRQLRERRLRHHRRPRRRCRDRGGHRHDRGGGGPRRQPAGRHPGRRRGSEHDRGRTRQRRPRGRRRHGHAERGDLGLGRDGRPRRRHRDRPRHRRRLGRRLRGRAGLRARRHARRRRRPQRHRGGRRHRRRHVRGGIRAGAGGPRRRHRHRRGRRHAGEHRVGDRLQLRGRPHRRRRRERAHRRPRHRHAGGRGRRRRPHRRTRHRHRHVRGLPGTGRRRPRGGDGNGRRRRHDRGGRARGRQLLRRHDGRLAR